MFIVIRSQYNYRNRLIHFYRSKSRSVDHGLAAPFANLDSLRSTVEGRFDSVERLSKGL